MTKFDKVIPPGSEGKVYATVDIAHSKGPIQKQISLETDDPDRAQSTLFIKADVKTDIDIQPTEQVTFRTKKGQPASQQLIITPAANKQITLHDPSVNANFIDLKMETRGNAYVLNVSLKPDTPVGTQQATIKIAEDGSAQKELTIPVLALIQGPISIAPPAISFDIRNYPDQVSPHAAANVRQTPGASAVVIDKVTAGTTLRVIAENTNWYQVITPANKAGWISKSIVRVMKAAQQPEPVSVALLKTNGEEFKVLDYSTELSQIKIEKVAENGKSYTFKVTLLAIDRTKKGNITGSILVKTNEPDQDSIRIPVYINVS